MTLQEWLEQGKEFVPSDEEKLEFMAWAQAAGAASIVAVLFNSIAHFGLPEMPEVHRAERGE